MTHEQLQALRDALIAGKVPDDKASPDRAFLRGWNEGVAFAEMQIDKILKQDPSVSIPLIIGE